MLHSYLTVSTISFFFFFNDTATTEIYTLSLHDALPISRKKRKPVAKARSASTCRCPRKLTKKDSRTASPRSEEHTSELQSRSDLVCRLLLEKKKKKRKLSKRRQRDRR